MFDHSHFRLARNNHYKIMCAHSVVRLILACVLSVFSPIVLAEVVPVGSSTNSLPAVSQTVSTGTTTKQAASSAGEENPYAFIAYPPVNYGPGAKAAQIKHGEYLVKAGDCISCHTVPNEGKPFAGGLAIKTPFGTMYTPNITSDKATGLGTWSDDDFVRAVREGISPEGQYYFPAFPYPNFNKLSRQDVLDIKAYLEAIPAVHQSNKPLDMPWPFNVRLLQSFWRFMFFDFHKGQFVYDSRESQEWNRGAYLVEGLGHCAMCHSPLNPLGAVKSRYLLAGGLVEGYPAPNISASGLKNVNDQKILNTFLKDQSFSGGQVKGPMLQVNYNSLHYLSVQDLTAIVTYLRSVQSEIPPAPNMGTGEAAGKKIYQNYCAGCHAMGGGGAPKFGDAKAWSPLISRGMDQVYKNAIHGIQSMPPKGNCQSCTDDQIKQAVDYIVKNSGAKPGSISASTTTITPVDLTSLARGKQVYNQVCSICHNAGKLGAPRLGDTIAWEPLIRENMDVLVKRAIDGYKGHPPKGACYDCNNADIIAAVKYMAQQSGMGDYRLW